ncbi:uncharacterized protein N7483_003486 [Penicillium malachiteum]|uniref:uncharacterized protein n=1 Tax=Penicillium malachiteum TaxID=1324776 RepID=UPI0025471656|nr:uncharacterized protein N7483_003486 [Penicillium malachiteum]KAJ5728978.1 hypothetical protein N7483_003486 [Penicillium malachiteum]
MVSTLAARRMRERSEKKQLRDFLKRISGERNIYSPTNEPIQLAQMRTLCAGYVPFNEDVCMCAEPWFGEMGSMVLGRRSLCSQSGYIGLAPPRAKTGDHVVVLEGKRLPFILRKVDGGFWKVIGECYVQGIMYGEAFDSQECRDIILV